MIDPGIQVRDQWVVLGHVIPPALLGLLCLRGGIPQRGSPLPVCPFLPTLCTFGECFLSDRPDSAPASPNYSLRWIKVLAPQPWLQCPLCSPPWLWPWPWPPPAAILSPCLCRHPGWLTTSSPFAQWLPVRWPPRQLSLSPCPPYTGGGPCFVCTSLSGHTECTVLGLC